MPTEEETRRRVRAALAMGGYANVEALANALSERDSGVGLRRLRLIWQTGESRAVERREIAAVCHVPTGFMEDGFVGAQKPDLEERVMALEERVEQLASVAALAALGDAANAAGDEPDEDRGQAGRQAG